MFTRILIANRGEIAVRVIATCRKMGIETIAVYSDADKDGKHVRMADHAVHIGAAPAADSYLQMERIVQACLDTGAQAVHPGFGFLSENAAFAEALAAKGIVFIGPPVGAIGAMGDKITSKKLAADAGVSTVPGHMGIVADAAEATEIARQIGYPVMIKASAGGGGKGMRIAHDDAEMADGFARATSEARSSFGDDRVFIEKFITEPRHIEIQVLGDTHGNVIYLHERECSIQRRHQKVIEEAPSPFLDPQTRAAMGAQAVALSKAVDYHSAGTVEFIVDADKNFYFLEMNTRLQVEHPVTEMITGIDLVEQMIRVAAGEKLSFGQDDIGLDGWAIEGRLYAEDPARGFLPSIGRLVHYREPLASESVRVDSGVHEGAEVSLYYDPMIAKVIAHGPDRSSAALRLRAALDAYLVRGVTHNGGFLTSVLAHPRFLAGRLTTNFLAEEYPDGFAGAALTDELRRMLIAAAGLIHHREVERAGRISGQRGGDRHRPRDIWIVGLDDERHEIALRPSGEILTVNWGETILDIASEWMPGQPLMHLTVDGEGGHVQVARAGDGWVLSHAGAAVYAWVRSPRAVELMAHMPEKAAADTSKVLLCPMPGLVVSIAVSEGQDVKAGEPLAVVEAMKMENVLRAERDGVVASIKAAPGDSLAVDDVIMEFAE